MGRIKGIISGGKGGRPRGQGLKGDSRDVFVCIVPSCEVSRRKDHLNNHQNEMVLWTSTGSPASEHHPEYQQASAAMKAHTDYFRENGWTQKNMPGNARKVFKGPLDAFFHGQNESPERDKRDDNERAGEEISRGTGGTVALVTAASPLPPFSSSTSGSGVQQNESDEVDRTYSKRRGEKSRGGLDLNRNRISCVQEEEEDEDVDDPMAIGENDSDQEIGSTAFNSSSRMKRPRLEMDVNKEVVVVDDVSSIRDQTGTHDSNCDKSCVEIDSLHTHEIDPLPPSLIGTYTPEDFGGVGEGTIDSEADDSESEFVSKIRSGGSGGSPAYVSAASPPPSPSLIGKSSEDMSSHNRDEITRFVDEFENIIDGEEKRSDSSPGESGSDTESQSGRRIESFAAPHHSPSGEGSVVVQIDENCIKKIADEICSRFANNQEVMQVGDIGKVIARRVHEEQENRARRAESIQKLNSDWAEDELTFTCMICLRNAQSPNVPRKFLKYRKGHFGIVSKGKKRNRDITNKMKDHCKSLLHIWCASVDEATRKQQEDDDAKNDAAANLIVTNVIHVLKDPTGSAKEFIRLNNKDDLNDNKIFGDKNDGSQLYFELRSLVFDKMTSKVKEMIQNVETIGCTLDKVTIGGVSYTVIVTFFFWEGCIKTVLNALFVMSTELMDGAGTAKMLVNTLINTLGLPYEQLRLRLEHLSYDGVYEQPLHRIRGGGGLSLIDHVRDYLQLGPDIITGITLFT